MILLSAGADGKKKDNNGKTAFDYAMDNPTLIGTTAYVALDNARY
jgi:hypothetical protein